LPQVLQENHHSECSHGAQMKKLPPRFKHQQHALAISKDKIAFAILAEMGTGKTRIIIETAAHLFTKGKIEALVILAPNGVQRNWVLNEIPKWCTVKYRAAWWASNPNRRQADAILKLTARPFDGLRILTANYESCILPKFKLYIKKFLISFPNMLTLDESTRIKTPAAKRTKFIVGLRKNANYRRIMSGFVTPNSPFDIYKQFEFLDPTILGYSSYFAFKAHYAEIEDNKFLLEAIQKRNMKRLPFTEMVMTSKNQIKLSSGHIIHPNQSGIVSVPSYLVHEAEKFGLKVKVSGRVPQLVKKSPVTGQPMYRNLDELYDLIAPHSIRVMKKDCLDIPDKVYGKLIVELTPKQRRIYDTVANELIAEFEEGEMTTALAITKMLRLQQIAGGFWKLDEDRESSPIDGKFPKMDAIIDNLEDTKGKVCIWTHFQHENRMIADTLREGYGEKAVVQYYGGVSNNNKQIAVDSFQNIVRDKKGNVVDTCESGVRFFVGEPHSGGIGIDLTLAEFAYYYSNGFNLEDRIQSEDRHHRATTRHVVKYNDVEALDTIDSKLIDALRAKKDVGHTILGDGIVNWLGVV